MSVVHVLVVVRRCDWSLWSGGWNLSGVLVVETVDAYWLIEDPTFDSLAPTASADTLHGDSLLANPGHDEIELGLPANIAPAAASGGALNTSESEMAWMLLNDLWDSEPDFFYEDVLAMTFFSDTSMDTLIDSGGSMVAKIPAR